MTATDTDALTEKIRDEVAGIAIGSGYYSTAIGIDEASEVAAAVLPIVAAEVRKAKAEAWDEGYEAGMLDTCRLGRDMDLTITPAPNPYRETGAWA